MNTVGFKPFEEVVEEVIALKSQRTKILIVGEYGSGKTTFLQTIKNRLGTDNIVYMDESDRVDDFLDPSVSSFATIIAGTPKRGLESFAEKLGLSYSARVEGLTGVVILTYQNSSPLGKFIPGSDINLLGENPVRMEQSRNQLMEEMAADFIKKAVDNNFSISELEKAIERLKLSAGSLKVVL